MGVARTSMAKGIAAFVTVTAFVLAISVMSGLGFYASMGVSYTDDADADVQNAADALVNQEGASQSQDNPIEDFTTSAGNTLRAGFQVVANLSGILKMLFGVPGVLAQAIQRIFQITYGITFAAFIRGVRLQ